MSRAGAVAVALTVVAAGCAGATSGEPRYGGHPARSSTSAPAGSLTDRAPEEAIQAVAQYVDDHPAVHVSIADGTGIFTVVDTSPRAVRGFTEIDGLKWYVRTHGTRTVVRSDQATDKGWHRLAPNTPGGRAMSQHVSFASVTAFFHVRPSDVEKIAPVSGKMAARLTIKGQAHIQITVVDDPRGPAPISVTSGQGAAAITLTYSDWGELITTRIPPH